MAELPPIKILAGLAGAAIRSTARVSAMPLRPIAALI
jgi:hypothetical protein